MDFVLHFTYDFHKNRFLRSQVCRVELIQSALESSDPGASNVGSNVEIWHFGAVLSTFKAVKLLQILKKITRIISNNLETRTFQKWPDHSQVVGFRRLAHCSMRQEQYFPAHFESALHDTPESL